MVKANFTHKLLTLCLLAAFLAACQLMPMHAPEVEQGRTGSSIPDDASLVQDGQQISEPREAQVVPPPRYRGSMVYDSRRGVMVLFGGSGSTGELADTWEYDGEQWQQVHPAQSPTPHAHHQMAYDANRGVVVLYGGGGIVRETLVEEEFPPMEPLTDTWEYDGTTWHQLSLSSATPDLDYLTTAMTYDARQQAVVLLGARHLYDSEYETWLYDGETWANVTTPLPENWGTHYPYLLFPDMVYDTQRQVVVLQGITSWTYEWDGQSWYTSVEADTPEALPVDVEIPTTLAYDSRRAVAIMFGNREANTTWEYNGQQWVAANPTQSPPARSFPLMAYDEARGVIVMFGGMQDNNMMLADTWEYDGATWTLKSEGEPAPLPEP